MGGHGSHRSFRCRKLFGGRPLRVRDISTVSSPNHKATSSRLTGLPQAQSPLVPGRQLGRRTKRPMLRIRIFSTATSLFSLFRPLQVTPRNVRCLSKNHRQRHGHEFRFGQVSRIPKSRRNHLPKPEGGKPQFLQIDFLNLSLPRTSCWDAPD